MMMVALNVTRSMTAAASRASVKVAPHSLNGALLATAMLARSFAGGDDLEQQLGAAGVQVQVGKFV